MNQEFRVPIPNGQLHVERTGSGPPVVLLHAGYLDTSMWEDQVESFAAEHTVIRFDARSHGRSSTAVADFRPEDDLLALLDHLDIARASLVGNSLGGATATTFALRYPERVDRLVLAGPGITPMEFHDPFVLDQYQEQVAARAAGDAEGYVEAFLRYGVDGPYRQPSEVSPRIRQRCRDMALRTVRRHHTAAGTILEHDTVSALERITAPTRIIVGELELSDLHRITDIAAERMPIAGKIVMSGCGHMMNMEQPMRFNELALEHLASLPDGEVPGTRS